MPTPFAPWPVVKTYAGPKLRRLRLPIGGIGTGTVSLAGNGGLVDWEIRNRPEKGFTPFRDGAHPAFVLRAVGPDGVARARLLEGPLDPGAYEGECGCAAPNHGYPRFRECAFHAAYPLAQVEMRDPGMPVAATLEAFNPLVPGDAEASGMPVALLRWRLENLSGAPARVSVAAVMPNPAEGERAQERRGGGGLAGVVFRGAGQEGAECDATRGELAVVVPETAGAVTIAADVRQPGWNDALDQFWRRLVARGDVGDSDAPGGDPCAFGCVCVQADLAPGEVLRVPFVIAWRFPHREAWSVNYHEERPAAFAAANDVGNHYCVRFPSAWDAAAAFFRDAAGLEAATVAFVRQIAAAPAPEAVKEAGLFNLSTLRCQTCFRTADGHFFGWEGVFDRGGSCFGSCTHVWGYEHALVDLWPALARDMCELQFGASMADDGMINFRICLPLAHARDHGKTAADGQMQCVIKAYEYWRRSGDDAWARRWWPAIRKAMAYCWLPGGWDGDQDGVMEGCQHNTMDVDYYGPNPQMQFLYLAALQAAAALAEGGDDAAFAARCRDLAAQGAAWTEANLFNGEYYEHQIRSARGPFLEGTRAGWNAQADPDHPDFQLGPGCLIDQLVGDYAARAVGLAPVADPGHARAATAAVLRHNRREQDDATFNNMRDYVLAGERSLRMAWYPEGRALKTPFPYYRETMTGFEHVVAAWLALVGDYAAAAAVTRDVRDRYDGEKRNPFDEAECGHHYVRAMAAWTTLRAFAPEVRP